MLGTRTLTARTVPNDRPLRSDRGSHEQASCVLFLSSVSTAIVSCRHNAWHSHFCDISDVLKSMKQHSRCDSSLWRTSTHFDEWQFRDASEEHDTHGGRLPSVVYARSFLGTCTIHELPAGMWTWESYASRYEKKLQKLDDTECAGGEDRRGVIERLRWCQWLQYVNCTFLSSS